MKIKRILAYILSVFFIFVVWQITAQRINAPLILPLPKAVFDYALVLCKDISFWKIFLYTFIRIFLAFAITLICGSLLGLLTSVSQFLHDFFELPLSIIRTTPIIALILMAVFWFKSDFVPVFVAVLMTLPVMTEAVYSGFKTVDVKLLTMAKTFELSKFQVFRYIKMPNCRPFFMNGALSAFGLSWKVVIAGEVISIPEKAIGSFLQQSQIHLETVQVIAVTVIVVLICFFLELIGKRLIKRSF